MADQSSVSEYRILALYRFVSLLPSSSDDQATNEGRPDRQSHEHPVLKKLQTDLYDALRPLHVRGTLLLAPEGINGTICYPYSENKDASSASDGAPGETSCNDMNIANDAVYRFLKSHPLFGGEALRTRLSVWKDYFNDEEMADVTGAGDTGNAAQQTIQELKQPQQAFQRLKIKIKAEIVTMGLGRPLFRDGKVVDAPSVENATDANRATTTKTRQQHNQKCNPLLTKGQYLSPKSWNDAIKDPEVLVIDTRNTYEIDIGTFDGAVDPKTKHFSEFPDYLKRLSEEFDWSEYRGDSGDDGMTEGQTDVTAVAVSSASSPSKTAEKKKKPPKAIAMFCTGGIRCEKSTSYAIQSNLFPKNMPIYHLEGGILAYLDYAAQEKNAKFNHSKNDDDDDTTTEFQSTFHGECFVFDKRVAVTEGLKPSKNYIPCYGCRGPMDRRLLLEASTCAGEKRKVYCKEVPVKYTDLTMGIANLPPFHYDVVTKAWYLPGLTCPRCHDTTTRESLERFAQRREQMEICRREGKEHFRDGKA